MKSVVITGATGFIGKALSKKLLREGLTVYGVDLDIKKLEELSEWGDFIPIVAEFRQYPSLHEQIHSRNIDVFYHLAWQSVTGNEFLDYEVQLQNAKFVCDAVWEAIKMKCPKFVYAQTSNYFEIRDYVNGDICEPRYSYVYSAAKTVAEIIAKTIAHNEGIEFCSGSVCRVYGEDNPNAMQDMPYIIIKKLLEGIQPSLVDKRIPYDMIYIADVTEAFYAIGKFGIDKKTYYIGSRVIKTIGEWFSGIRDIVNPDIELLYGAYKDAKQFDYSSIDLDALYNDTGFECQDDYAESILKTSEWIKNYINECEDQ